MPTDLYAEERAAKLQSEWPNVADAIRFVERLVALDVGPESIWDLARLGRYTPAEVIRRLKTSVAIGISFFPVPESLTVAAVQQFDHPDFVEWVRQQIESVR